MMRWLRVPSSAVFLPQPHMLSQSLPTPLDGRSRVRCAVCECGLLGLGGIGDGGIASPVWQVTVASPVWQVTVALTCKFLAVLLLSWIALVPHPSPSSAYIIIPLYLLRTWMMNCTSGVEPHRTIRPWDGVGVGDGDGVRDGVRDGVEDRIGDGVGDRIEDGIICLLHPSLAPSPAPISYLVALFKS